MGIPIAGQKQFPFGRKGVTVHAMLPDGTPIINLRILKQRSSKYYDLMSYDGSTIYPFMKITDKDKDGYSITSSVVDAVNVQRLNEGTFYIPLIKPGDYTGSNGSITKFQSNKVLYDKNQSYYLDRNYNSLMNHNVSATGFKFKESSVTYTLEDAKQTQYIELEMYEPSNLEPYEKIDIHGFIIRKEERDNISIITARSTNKFENGFITFYVEFSGETGTNTISVSDLLGNVSTIDIIVTE